MAVPLNGLAAGSPLHGLRYLRQQSEGAIALASDAKPTNKGMPYRRSLSSRRKTPLEEEIAVANAEIVSLRSKLQAAEDLAAHRKSLLHAAETENNKLRWRLQISEKQALTHRAKASAAQARISQSRDLVEVADEKIAGLQSQLDVLEAEATNWATKDINFLSLEAQAAKENYANIKAEANKVEAIAQELSSELKILETRAVEPPRSLAESCLTRERMQLIEAHRANAKGESEMHANLLRNLHIAENRCRELDEALARKGTPDSRTSQQSSEVEALSRRLAQERAELQTVEAALQSSHVESRLAQEQHRLEKLVMNDEQRIRANNLAANGEVHVELAAAEANAANKAAQLLALRSALEERTIALRHLEAEKAEKAEKPVEKGLVDDSILAKIQREHKLLLNAREAIDGRYREEAQEQGKAAEVAQAAAAKNKVECDVLRASEMQSCELNEQLTQRLYRASAQCRELKTELADSKAMEASNEGKHAEILKLQRRLTQQRNDFQTTLSEAHSEFETRLMEQEANAAKLKLGDEKQKHASSNLIKELRAQLTQQRAAAKSSASQQEQQINELTTLFSAREKGLEEACARAKQDAQKQIEITEVTRNESRALLSKVVTEVGDWMAQLEAHLSSHERSLIPEPMQPARERSWGSQVSSSMDTDNTGLPPEFSMLHSLDSSNHSQGRPRVLDDDKNLQKLYQDLQAGLVKQRQAVQNVWSQENADSEEHLRATAAIHQDLHAQIQLIKQHESIANSSENRQEAWREPSSPSKLKSRCSSEERRMEKLAQEVQLQRQNLQEAQSSRRETSMELLKSGQASRKGALQKQLIRNLNSLSVSSTSPKSNRGLALRRKIQDLQRELETSEVDNDRKVTLPLQRELDFNTSTSSEDHLPSLVQPLLDQLARQERFVVEAKATVKRIAQVAENTKKLLEDDSPELSPANKSKGLNWLTSMRTQVISESDALWNATITEASTRPEQRDQHQQLQKCYEDLQAVLSHLQERASSSLVVEADESELRGRHKLLQRQLEAHLCMVLETQEQVCSNATEEAIQLRDQIEEAEAAHSRKLELERSRPAMWSVLDISTESIAPGSEQCSVSGFRDLQHDPQASLDLSQQVPTQEASLQWFRSVEERCEKLQNELEEELRTQLQSQEKALQDSATAVRSLHEELKAEKGVETPSAKITSLSGGLAALELQLASELKQLQSSAERARVDGEQKMQRMYSDLYKELTKQRELTREAMSQVVGGHDERLSAIEAKCCDLQAQADSLLRRGATSGISQQSATLPTVQVSGLHADIGSDALSNLKSRFASLLTQLSTTIDSTRGALQQTQLERDTTLDVARTRMSQLEEEMQRESRELQAQLREHRLTSKEERVADKKCIAELQSNLDRLRTEAERKMAQIRFTGDERLRATEKELDKLQAELTQHRGMAAQEASTANEHISELHAHLGRKRSDVEEAMAKAEMAGDLLHASATKNAALQAQLVDQQKIASSRIADLEAVEENLRQNINLKIREHASELTGARSEIQDMVDQITALRGADTINTEQTKQLIEELKAEARAKEKLEAECLAHHSAIEKYGTDLNTFISKRQELADECASLSATVRVEEMEAQRQKALSDATNVAKDDLERDFNAFRQKEEVEAGRQEAEVQAMRSRVNNMAEELAVHQRESVEWEKKAAAQELVIAKEQSAFDALTMAHKETQRSLNVAESRNAEMVDQRIGLAAESEKSACRNTILEAQLSDRQQKLQEVISREAERLLIEEARSQEYMEEAARKQQALDAFRQRAATEFEASQSSRHDLEVQMAELRGSYSSEVNCLQEQRQAMVDDANKSLSKALELEGKTAELQMKRSELEQSLASLGYSQTELEAEYSTYRAAEVAEVQHQRTKIHKLEVANEELDAQCEALRRKAHAEELQHQEDEDRRKKESQEHAATKEEYIDELGAFRRANAADLDNLRESETREMQAVHQEFAAELDAFKRLEGKVSAHRVAEMRCQELEVEALHAEAREMDANLKSVRKEAEEADNALVEQQRKHIAKSEQDKKEWRESQSLVHELKEELAAERLVVVDLDASKRAKASELLIAQREMESQIAAMSNLRSEAEQDWQQSQAKIKRLEDKLTHLRSVTGEALKSAKSGVEEIDEMNLFSERRY